MIEINQFGWSSTY